MDHYPGFLFGGEPWSLATKIGNDPTLDYGDANYPRFAGYGVGAAKFVFAQEPGLDVVNDFDRTDYRDRMAKVSAMMDTLDPDTLHNGQTHHGVGTSPGTVNGVPRNVDWFSLIENWTLRGRAPGTSVVATANHYAPPFQVLASKPVCAYPEHPRYVGGDPAAAAGYRCRR